MIKFIDTQYEKITWFLIAIMLISLFFANQYMSLVLLFYLLIKAVKFRETIRHTIRTTPLVEKCVHVVGVLMTIAAVTAVMYFSAGFMEKLNVSEFFLYVYIAVVLFVSIIIYSSMTNFILKMLKKASS